MITQYALLYVQEHSRDLEKKSSAIDFSRKVITDNETWNQFLSFVSAQGYATTTLSPTEKPAIEKSIQAAIDRKKGGKAGGIWLPVELVKLGRIGGPLRGIENLLGIRGGTVFKSDELLGKEFLS